MEQLLKNKIERLEKKVADLLNELKVVKEESGKLKKENKQLKERVSELEESDKEVLQLLTGTHQEADKMGVRLIEIENLLKEETEIPPK